MPDDDKKQQGDDGSQPVTQSDGSQTMQTASGGQVQVSAEVQEKFPELVPMVLESKSMDDEEREYWLSMLPVMTPDQVDELRDILDSEQKEGGGKPEGEGSEV